jgi:hypothetical protein
MELLCPGENHFVRGIKKIKMQNKNRRYGLSQGQCRIALHIESVLPSKTLLLNKQLSIILNDNTKGLMEKANEVVEKMFSESLSQCILRVENVSEKFLVDKLVSSIIKAREKNSTLKKFTFEIYYFDYDLLSNSSKESLKDNIVVLKNYSNPGLVDNLVDYLNIRAKSQSFVFLHRKDQIEDLFEKGHRNFYGVLVDEECNPILDTCEPLPGYFDTYQSKLNVNQQQSAEE